MACPEGARYTTELFKNATEALDLWELGTCAYGTPLGEAAVGSIVYSGIALHIFIRTGSVMLPFVLALTLGGTVLAQMFAVIGVFAAALILLTVPVVLTAYVYLLDRRG